MAIFSGSSGKRTALLQQAAAEKAQKDASAALAQGQALALQQLWGAQPQQIQALQQGQAQALGALGQSRDAALGYYDQAIPLYDKYRDTGLQALQSYANAAGLNGDEGRAKAEKDFSLDPGRVSQIKIATNEAQRAAGAVGELYSGNTAAAVSDRAGQIANQGYGDYINRLGYLNDQGYNATGAQAALLQGKAGVEGGYGQAAAGLYDTGGARLADISGKAAEQAAGIYGNSAALQAQSLANLGKQTIDAYGFAQGSQDRADSNALALGIAGLNAAGNFAGAMFPKPKVV